MLCLVQYQRRAAVITYKVNKESRRHRPRKNDDSFLLGLMTCAGYNKGLSVSIRGDLISPFMLMRSQRREIPRSFLIVSLSRSGLPVETAIRFGPGFIPMTKSVFESSTC